MAHHMWHPMPILCTDGSILCIPIFSDLFILDFERGLLSDKTDAIERAVELNELMNRFPKTDVG